MSFSWFADREHWYAERSGTWKFTGRCTSSEQYYILFHRPGYGFFDSADRQRHWVQHVRRKVWFDPVDFGRMLDRFVAAGGQHVAVSAEARAEKAREPAYPVHLVGPAGSRQLVVVSLADVVDQTGPEYSSRFHDAHGPVHDDDDVHDDQAGPAVPGALA